MKYFKKIVEGWVKDQLDSVPKQTLKNNRPDSWEDDISRNALDTDEFENRPAPSELDYKTVLNPVRSRNIEPLLGDNKLVDMLERDVFPIPPNSDREGYLPGYDGAFWATGIEDYLKVMEIADRYNIEVRSIFDFGCASGRVTRHFAIQTDIPEVWCSDINARHIRWLYENMPSTVKPIFNHSIPSLPIRDNSIDIVTAFSVFTHMDTFETSWLAELQRIMRDDGLAYITVQNEDAWDYLGGLTDTEFENSRVIKTLLSVDANILEKLKHPMQDTRTIYRYTNLGPYRALTFHSNNYIKNVWGRFFEVLEIIPRHHVNQTVVVLKKK